MSLYEFKSQYLDPAVKAWTEKASGILNNYLSEEQNKKYILVPPDLLDMAEEMLGMESKSKSVHFDMEVW